MKRGAILAVIVLIILASGISNPLDTGSIDNYFEPKTAGKAHELKPQETNLLSDHFTIGANLNPAIIEQRGNKTSATLQAATDSKTNVKTALTLDTANNWVGSRASVNLWNLKRLYVANGSLSEGIEGQTTNPTGGVSFYPYGWDAISGGSDPSMDMLAEYTNQEIGVTANGYGTGGNYFYANGSYVYWTQFVNNTPYLENFILNFDYLYDQGPDLSSNVTLKVFANDIEIWTNTTETMTTSLWYNSGNIQVGLSGIDSQFEFKIGIYMNGSFYHNKQFIGFILDNIQFLGATNPTFDAAAITMDIGLNSATVIGATTGYASITNSSLWQTDDVMIELTSDLAYSFDYIATLLSHRYINSTKSLTLLDDGVHFNAELNTPSLIEFYTFIGTLPVLDDFTMFINTPFDWENATIYNPSGTVVTSSCSITSGLIVIPNSILTLDNLGWWEIHINAPNYARNIQTLKLIEPGMTWLPDTLFRSTNVTKPMIEIGDTAPILGSLQDVNITWLMPDDTKWFTELISGGIDGAINGTQLEVGATNTTAGIWEVIVFWSNGTELAFGSASFQVYHKTTLTPHWSSDEIESGQIISNFVYFQDSDNSEFLTNPLASISANWSSTTINFVPDPLLNRWIGNFDTSLVGPGSHLVVVNASSPYYDDSSCTFTITIRFANNELTIDNPTANVGIGDKYLVTFTYSDAFGIGIPGANVSVDYSGTPDGVTWGELNDLGGGDYSLEFTAIHSDSYAITISVSKDHYNPGEDVLFMFVGEKSTTFTLENGTSAVISFGEQYRLVVRFTNGTGYGLDNATVAVFSTTPENGISHSNASSEGDGFFSFILTPADTETFTLLIRASLADHETQLKSFTLTATVISTQLQIIGTSSPASIEVETSFELLVFFEKTGSNPINISLADLQLNFTSYENLDYMITPLADGAEGYIIILDASRIGSYEFTIYANKTGYQSDFESFTLFVTARGMRVIMDAPLWTRLSNLEISLQLVEAETNFSISGANVSYRLTRFGGIVMEGYLSELPNSPGVYFVSIMPQWVDDTGYSIRIFAIKANYELVGTFEYQVLQYTPPGILWQILVTIYGPPVAIVAAIAIISVSGRFVYIRKKKAEFKIDLANQRRFDDADNIIGVIVMHKASGIPIYSRIVKGGFEEGIVAAFISAVTHFREEFEFLDEESLSVIPISDIIRAVQTRNLICAFVTVRSASIEHNRKIEEFAKEASRYLDDFYMEAKPPSVMDTRITEIINYVFDETMDGQLLKYHKIRDKKKLPKRYVSIEQVLLDLESEHCSKPIYLAKALSKYGVPESRGCTLVSEAIEKEYIVLCEESEFPDTDIDLHKFLNKRGIDERE
ncbi:MAG: hypothetical protein ACFFFO_10340 [Candidatus Thorarchaeota archaeon]